MLLFLVLEKLGFRFLFRLGFRFCHTLNTRCIWICLFLLLLLFYLVFNEMFLVEVDVVHTLVLFVYLLNIYVYSYLYLFITLWHVLVYFLCESRNVIKYKIIFLKKRGFYYLF